MTVPFAPSPQQSTTTTTIAKIPLPTADQFTIDVKILSKKCFGSAGCLVTFQIEPKYIGPGPLPKETFTVVYEILGGDDPQTNRFTVSADKANFDGEESIQTPKSSSQLTAKVTGIIQ